MLSSSSVACVKSATWVNSPLIISCSEGSSAYELTPTSNYVDSFFGIEISKYKWSIKSVVK